jgi:hypothetical protein
MAKIKPAGSGKKSKGPANPGGIGCLILLILGFAVFGLVLYLSIARA